MGLSRDGGSGVAVGCARNGGIDSWVVFGLVEVEPCVQITAGHTFPPTSEMDVWVPRTDLAEIGGWIGGTY